MTKGSCASAPEELCVSDGKESTISAFNGFCISPTEVSCASVASGSSVSVTTGSAGPSSFVRVFSICPKISGVSVAKGSCVSAKGSSVSAKGS